MHVYSTYKESGYKWIGQIPNDWEIYPAKYIFTENKNKNYEGSVTNSLKFRFGKIVPKANFDAESDEYVADTITSYTVVEPDTIIVNGLNLNYDFKSMRVGIVKEKGVITSAYLAVVPNKELINPYFANYLLKGYETRMAFHNMGTGLRLTLGFKEFKNQPIVLPDRKTQDFIVEFLNKQIERIDSLIEEAKESIEEYKSLKASIIYEAVTRGLNPDVEIKDSGIDWIGMIPAHWTLSRVKNIGSTQNGVSKGGDYFGEGYPFVNYGDVYKNYELPRTGSGLANASPEDRETYSVQYGDIFFTRTSETAEEVRFSAVCKSTIENATFSGFVIRLRPYIVDSVIQTNYAKYYFRSPHIRNYLVKEMNIVTRVSLSQSLLRDMSVTVPPIDEQDSISHYLDDKCEQIDSVIREKAALIDDLEAYKKSLIYEVVTGKKKVK